LVRFVVAGSLLHGCDLLGGIGSVQRAGNEFSCRPAIWCTASKGRIPRRRKCYVRRAIRGSATTGYPFLRRAEAT